MIHQRSNSHAQRLKDALEGKLDGYLRTDPASRALWSTDGSIYLRRPVGVVIARSEEDVRRRSPQRGI
jgi:FAD/FMN-containing dehydrogenase